MASFHWTYSADLIHILSFCSHLKSMEIWTLKFWYIKKMVLAKFVDFCWFDTKTIKWAFNIFSLEKANSVDNLVQEKIMRNINEKKRFYLYGSPCYFNKIKVSWRKTHQYLIYLYWQKSHQSFQLISPQQAD